MLARRDLSVRYKQTLIGVAWVVIRPLLTVVLLTFVFGKVAALPSDGLAYPALVLSGMLVWQLFSGGFAAGAHSLVADQQLITKVYFPRLVIPLSAILAGTVDFGITLILVLGVLPFFGWTPSLTLLALPPILIGLLLFITALSLLVAAWNVRFRDFRYLLPFVLQFGLYASPVGYLTTAVPANYQWLMYLNPLTTFIDLFRWALLATPFPPGYALSATGLTTFLLLLLGFSVFRKTEAVYADII